MANNRSLLAKTDMALNDIQTNGGLLNPAQSKKFMQLLIKNSVLMQQCTVRPMRSHTEMIDQIRFEDRILRVGNEYTALGESDRTKPNIYQKELQAKLFKAEIRLSDELLEDNIENGTFRQTILSMFAEKIATDMEDLLINSDTANADLPAEMRQINGILAQCGTNVVDAAGKHINKDLFHNMLKALPSQYLRKRNDYRFFTSINRELDYRHYLTERMTNIGDRYLDNNSPVVYGGVGINAVPFMPEGTNGEVLLMDPKNVVVGMWRNLKLEHDRDISSGYIKFVMTLRWDAKVIVDEATVKAINVGNLDLNRAIGE